MVALRRAELPDPTRLTELLSDWPCALQPESNNPDILMMQAPTGWAACALMRVPIPFTETETVPQALRDHTAHLILHVGSGELDALDTWLLLTKLAAAVVQSTDAAGVYWGAASTIHEPAVFTELAKSASREEPPLMIWVGFHTSRTDAGTSVFTTGMDAFGAMDIEVRDSELEPSAIVERLFGVAVYCIQTGKPLHDGDTIGESDAERIPVKHVPSAFLPGRLVRRVVLEPPARPPWRTAESVRSCWSLDLPSAV
jgi:hypothetical protein